MGTSESFREVTQVWNILQMHTRISQVPVKADEVLSNPFFLILPLAVFSPAFPDSFFF